MTSDEDVRHECDRLFMAAAPFVRAEQEAEEALKQARATLKAARKAAAAARATWVDYLLTHDHRGLCLLSSVARTAMGPGGQEL